MKRVHFLRRFTSFVVMTSHSALRSSCIVCSFCHVHILFTRSRLRKRDARLTHDVEVLKHSETLSRFPEHLCGAGKMGTHIMLFTKHPTPKFAKTRLIPAIGAEAAAEISKQLTEIALRTVREYVNTQISVKTIIHYYAPQNLPLNAMESWLIPTANETLRQQSPGDLGDRLISSFKSSFADGAAKVVVIGSDCPGITANLLSDAFKALDRADVVIGPAVDGGYYLLGMKGLHETLFTDIPWSTSSVYERTCAAAEREGLTVISLQPLRDIDTEEDLPYFSKLLSENS